MGGKKIAVQFQIARVRSLPLVRNSARGVTRVSRTAEYCTATNRCCVVAGSCRRQRGSQRERSLGLQERKAFFSAQEGAQLSKDGAAS